MSEINITYRDFPNVCRICSSHGEDLQKFNWELINLYKLLTNFEVKMDDRFPKNICIVCKKYLDDINTFVKKCKNNEALLKKIYHEEFLKQNEETLYKGQVQVEPKTEQGVEVHRSQPQIKIEEIDCEIPIKEEKIDCEVPVKVEADDTLPIEVVYNLSAPPSNDFVVAKTDKQTHKKLKRFVCDICGKDFIRKITLKDHMNIHTGERPYKCAFCGKGFKTKFSKTVHVYRVHNEGVEEIPTHERKYAEKRVRLRLQCEICGKILASRFGYDYHQLTHKEKKDFLCNICGKKFINNCALQAHHRSHTKGTPFECKDCGKFFKLKASLQIHMSRHKTNNINKILNCPHCDKKYSTEIGLNNHVLEHTDKPLKCPYCSEQFNEEDMFRNHLVEHVINKVHRCDVCNKLFPSSTQLKDHSRVHTGKKPYTCSVCGKQLAAVRTLKVHMRQHTGEKPFVCSICGRGFHDSSTFRKHLKGHNGKNKTSTKISEEVDTS